jgi:hypothetical protein
MSATLAIRVELPGEPPARTFHPWPQLPSSLKRAVLDLLLLNGRAVTTYSHDACTFTAKSHEVWTTSRALLALLSISKETRDLAYRSYYKHGVILRTKFSADETGFLRAPSKLVSPHIRRVELRLHVPSIFSANNEWDLVPDGFEMQELQELLHLLRLLGTDEKSTRYIGEKTAWQRELRHIETLKIELFVKGKESWRHAPCLEGSEAWKGIFGYLAVATSAKCADVRVVGFACGADKRATRMDPCPWDCEGTVVKDLQVFIVSQRNAMGKTC